MNKTKRLLFPVLVIFLMSLMTVSYGQQASAAPIKLRYSSALPPRHSVSLDQKWWGKEVEKRSNGRIVVEVYQAAELYKHSEVPDAVITGAVDMGLGSLGEAWPGRNPFFEVTQLWFLIRSSEQVEGDLDTIRNIVFPLFQKLGVKALHFWAFGEGGIWSRRKVSSAADVKGMRIRAPTQGDWVCIKALGGTAAQIPAGEMYDALTKGAIDGIRTGFESGFNRKLYEPAKYLSGPTQFTLYFAFMNPKVWNEMPKDLQDIVMEVSRETEARNFETSKKGDDRAKAKLKDLLDFHVFTTQEVGQWISVMQPVYDAWMEKATKAGSGAQAKQLYDLLKK